jgi:hypothetical protein
VSVRGYDTLQPWLVRWATPAVDEVAAVHAFEDLLDEIADDVLGQAADPAPGPPPPAS